MTTYTIDTAAAIKRMADAGLPHAQAEAIVETFAESNDSLATKADLRALEAAMDKLEARLTVRIITAQVATAALLFTLLKFFG